MKRTRAVILAEIRALKANKDNYTSTVVRADPYSLVATHISKKTVDSEIFSGMTFKGVRAYCKGPLMKGFYNSRLEPIKAFGEDTKEFMAFYATREELFPGAVKVLEAINESWDSDALHNAWPTPDGHEAYVKVMEKVHGTISAGGMEFAYTYNSNRPSERFTSLAPNFTHGNDGFLVRHIVDNAPCEVFHVHDDIKAHPNNMDVVSDLYVDGFNVMLDFKPLDKLLGYELDIDYTEIRKGLSVSSYHLC